MVRTITICLPVADVEASRAFYVELGFTHNTAFPDPEAAQMIWSDAISVMLLAHDKWRTFTARPIPPPTSSEMALNVTCESRDMVDAMNDVASRLGGLADVNPVQDHPFMYGRDFTDPDGHVWGAMWVDPSVIPVG